MSWIKDKWRYLLAQMLREKAPVEFIARGWAIGMFYGCTIPFGFQLLFSVPTAVFLKGSKVGATLGTFITNHFTIFLIYPLQFWLGNRMLELFGAQVTPVSTMMEELKHVGSFMIWTSDFWQALGQMVEKDGGATLVSFFLGGFLLAAVTVPLTYIGVFRYVKAHRARRDGRRRARATTGNMREAQEA